MELCEFLDDGCGEDWDVGFLGGLRGFVLGCFCFVFLMVSGCQKIGVWGNRLVMIREE